MSFQPVNRSHGFGVSHILLCFFLFNTVSVLATEDQGVAKPDAMAILNKVSLFHQSIESLSVQIDKKSTSEKYGFKQTWKDSLDCRYVQPNQLSIVPLNGSSEPTFISDGRDMTTYIPLLHEYQQTSAPATMNGIISPWSGPGRIVSQLVPFIDFILLKQPAEEFTKLFPKMDYVERVTIDGVDCHHLKLHNKQLSWDFYINAGGNSNIVRFTPDLSAYAKLGESIHYQWDFKNWQVNQDISKADFEFNKPAGAKKVDNFTSKASEGNHALIGKPAAGFSLEKLGGGKIDLASHKGKDVVVLDFWATWCKPCVDAMPKLISVTNQFKGKGVVFYAVNVRESDERVKRFLASRKLDVTVLMDRTNRVAESYQVSGIPQTVIIDKNGVVSNVHVGFIPGMETKMVKELQDLLVEKQAVASNVDLSCQAVSFAKQKIKVGDKVALKLHAENLGSEIIESGTFNIRLKINNQEAYVGPAYVSLNASSSETIVIPEDLWHFEFTKPGKFKYELTLDSESHLDEKNEKNNRCMGELEIISL